MRCRCGYEWEARVENPKACPECKRRLGFKSVGEVLGRPKEVDLVPVLKESLKRVESKEDVQKVILEGQRNLEKRRAQEGLPLKKSSHAETCTLYGCLICKSLGVKDARRGM